jgi:hypothetical protein
VVVGLIVVLNVQSAVMVVVAIAQHVRVYETDCNNKHGTVLRGDV